MKKTRFIGLIRGINVGGKNKINMADLRSKLQDAGFDEVSTYIQSGNVFFASDKSVESLEEALKQLIHHHFDCDVPVLIRELKFFRRLITENRFANADQSKLHATILHRKPDIKLVAQLDSEGFAQDKFEIVRDVVYVYCPNGYSKTKLTNGFFESKLKVSATTRNWNTVNRLVEIAESLSGGHSK